MKISVKKSRGVLSLSIVGLAALPLGGCAGKYTGGGYIDSVSGGAKDKATFGFNIDSTDVDGDDVADVVKGQFQYNDRAAGVSFHVVVDKLEPFIACDPSCLDDGSSKTIPYSGHYKSEYGDGNVTLGVTSIKDVYGSQVNSLYIFGVSSGPYRGYSNSRVVRGGNIQFHPPK